MDEETDLTYEGIETWYTDQYVTSPFLWHEETDLTYEGIETRHTAHYIIGAPLGRRNRPDLRRD